MYHTQGSVVRDITVIRVLCIVCVWRTHIQIVNLFIYRIDVFFFHHECIHVFDRIQPNDNDKNSYQIVFKQMVFCFVLLSTCCLHMDIHEILTARFQRTNSMGVLLLLCRCSRWQWDNFHVVRMNCPHAYIYSPCMVDCLDFPSCLRMYNFDTHYHAHSRYRVDTKDYRDEWFGSQYRAKPFPFEWAVLVVDCWFASTMQIFVSIYLGKCLCNQILCLIYSL